MREYLIGYDLHKPEQDYPDLLKTIREAFGDPWNELDSTWVVRSVMTAKEIRALLQPHLGQDDEILVVRLGVEHSANGFGTPFLDWRKQGGQPYLVSGESPKNSDDPK